MNRRIVLSGTGLVSAYGSGVAPYWDGLCSGRGALGPARRFADAPGYRGEPVGEVPEFDPRGEPRKSAYARAALAEAQRSARLPVLPPGALVILVGQAPAPEGGGQLDGEEWELFGPSAELRPDGAAVLHLSHACASAAFAVALARTALAAGAAPLVAVVGASVLNRYEYASMDVVRAVARTAARPFDVDRDGISLGEGGGAVILETADRARERGLRADLTVAGAACRVGGKLPAASDPGAVTDCLRTALAEAGADRLDHVHAHATGTAQGDTAELAAVTAIAAELDTPEVPVTSHKGAIGHLLHISAVPALAAAALSLRTRIVPPTPGLTTPEPADRVHHPRAETPYPGLRVAAVNSFGFGGNNATVVLRRD
ncbi:beta-ketoacyl synthase N-terminal-like domain-containing protein [Streptomyces sp. NRRL WC-3742]|uniref:beta-ketoacyl synthase N-terminal-like domain-containing protein n=1 Tax=Streptomyces sp. NRRL WC-3742 TaxID=1463934 RepID=UPI0004CA9DE9|nr:beta-ketoacyl synthase N-terminal-like domain-containing protein [Streptomyces sp. NRRL WC-3742]